MERETCDLRQQYGSWDVVHECVSAHIYSLGGGVSIHTCIYIYIWVSHATSVPYSGDEAGCEALNEC